MHVICHDCTEFWDEIFLRGGECKTRKNSNFLKNGKMVILVKIRNFSISWMMKRSSPLESSREILLPRRILRQPEFHVYRGNRGSVGHLTHFEWIKRCHVSCAELVKHELKYEPWVDTWHDAI